MLYFDSSISATHEPLEVAILFWLLISLMSTYNNYYIIAGILGRQRKTAWLQVTSLKVWLFLLY